MASRKPLVVQAGVVRQIDSTDTMSVPASEPVDWDAGLSGPSEVITSNLITFEMPDGNTKDVLGNIQLPQSVDLSSNPKLYVHFNVNIVGTGNANVRLNLNATYIAAGELISQAAQEALPQTVAVTDTLDRLHEAVFTLNASLMAAGDRIKFQLERLGNDAADTYTGSIGIVESARFDYRG